jgi:DNA invertase Pin-like site-specific DNA recombinase
MSKQYVIYCRKSSESEERQVLSIEAQVKELEQLRERLNLPVSDILTESRSAKYPGRPIFGTVMDRVSRGEIKGIICWKLDRLARNPLDGAAIVWALDQGKIEDIITPYNRLSNNSNDKFLMQLEFGMAKKYVDDLSDNTKRGIRLKLEKGWLPGPAPLGYVNEPREKIVVPDPEKFHIVRKMWDLLLEGVPPLRIHRIATEKFGLRSKRGLQKLVNITTVYTIFANPFYYGIIRHAGNLYQGNHEPMITEAEFWKAQEILGRRGIPRPKKRSFAFTGLMRCGECGYSITAEEMVNPYGTHYTYYHCTKKKHYVKCAQPTIRAEELERQIKGYLERIYIPESLVELGLDYLKGEQREHREKESILRGSLEKAHGDSLRRLENLNQMRLRELISDEEYLSEKRKLLDEKIRLEESLNAKGSGLNKVHDLTVKTFKFAHEALERFESGTPEIKKAIVHAIGSNFSLRDRKLSIDVEKPFELIEKTLNALSPEINRLQLSKNEMDISQSALPRPQFLVWCRIV